MSNVTKQLYRYQLNGRSGLLDVSLYYKGGLNGYALVYASRCLFDKARQNGMSLERLERPADDSEMANAQHLTVDVTGSGEMFLSEPSFQGFEAL